MATYFTADSHLGHFNIIEYENRPFDNADDMDHALVTNWNQIVKPNDLVYHLGDVSMHKKTYTKALVSALNGTKVLIRGNHDRGVAWMLDCGFAAVLEGAELKIGRHECYLSHEPRRRDFEEWNVHGHIHSRWKADAVEKRICVSVENWGYAPVEAKKLVSIMDKDDV